VIVEKFNSTGVRGFRRIGRRGGRDQARTRPIVTINGFQLHDVLARTIATGSPSAWVIDYGFDAQSRGRPCLAKADAAKEFRVPPHSPVPLWSRTSTSSLEVRIGACGPASMAGDGAPHDPLDDLRHLVARGAEHALAQQPQSRHEIRPCQQKRHIDRVVSDRRDAGAVTDERVSASGHGQSVCERHQVFDRHDK
jgi:hypothetical protein